MLTFADYLYPTKSEGKRARPVDGLNAEDVVMLNADVSLRPATISEGERVDMLVG